MTHDAIRAPGRLGRVTTRNRICLPPMEKNWCDRLGNPTRQYIDYYAERARQGVGMMNFEATYIDARGRGNLFQLGLWRDENIPGHRRLNEAVQAHGCRTSAELNHGGRNANTHRTGLQPVGPSDCPSEIVGGHHLHELTPAEIGEIVAGFRAAAGRAVRAGYDMITIHGAHGYLITSFLSQVYNRRTDRYGGSEENRWRFLVEVYTSIREEVGAAMPVGVRLSAEEDVAGGFRIDDTIRLVRHLSSLGLDFVDLSTGLYESLETLIQPMDMPEGCLLPLARRMKQKVSIPVLAAGRITSLDAAEQALAAGDCDFVQMGRAFHADPELLTKSLAGRAEDVVGCIACNKCCAELFVNRPSVCTVNPDAGRERFSALAPAPEGRRIVVVGGGLAGMETARVAARRGHEVELFEMTDRLGGWVNVLASTRARQDWHRAVRDRERMCRQAGVQLHLERRVAAADIERERPDAVVVATGTRPFLPEYVPGIDLRHVTHYDDLLRGRVDAGAHVVVLGGQLLGLTAAEFLAEGGSRVTVIEATGGLADDLEFMARKMLLARVQASNRIDTLLATNVEEIHAGHVVLQCGGERRNLGDVDQVVVALEREMNRDLVEELTSASTAAAGIEFHMVGDCVWPGEPGDAVSAGNRLGRSL